VAGASPALQCGVAHKKLRRIEAPIDPKQDQQAHGQSGDERRRGCLGSGLMEVRAKTVRQQATNNRLKTLGFVHRADYKDGTVAGSSCACRIRTEPLPWKTFTRRDCLPVLGHCIRCCIASRQFNSSNGGPTIRVDLRQHSLSDP